jgi:transcriptional regulator with XRE-family HTH domain
MSKAIFVLIGKRITGNRRTANMTRLELARRAGITVQQLGAYEEAECAIPASHLWAIALAQGSPVGYFVEDTDNAHVATSNV